MRGIDVSKYQRTPDWQTVKDAGVEFAILRAGYGREISQKDPQFERNYAECTRVGLPAGVYWYSYAGNPAEMLAEVDVLLQCLAGKQLAMPVYLDIEDKAQTRMDKPTLTAAIDAALQKLEAAGYFVGVYTYTHFAQYMNYEALAKKYTMWLADYRKSYDRTLPRDIHQYTSRGTVPGIQGNVDMNNCTRDFPKIIKGAGLNGWRKRPDKPTPPSTKPHPQPQTGGTYTVRPGDSWWKIAAKTLGDGAKMEHLAAANGKTILAAIHPGDVLEIPGGTAPTQRTYTVLPGDSWYRIAAQQLGSGSRMQELAAANGRTTADTIHPGQTLVLPE